MRRFGGADRLVARVRARRGARRPRAASGCDCCCARRSRTRSPGRCATRCWSAPARPRRSPSSRGAGLLVPLDRTDERFRHHRLLADALRAELRRTASGARGGAAPARERVAPAAARRRPRARPRARAPATSPAPATSCGRASPEAVAQGRIGLAGALARPLHAGADRRPAAARALRGRLRAGARPRPRGRRTGPRRPPRPRPGADPAARGRGRRASLRAALGGGGPARMRDDAARASAAPAARRPVAPLCCLLGGAAHTCSATPSAARGRARGGRARRGGGRAARPCALPRRARGARARRGGLGGGGARS